MVSETANNVIGAMGGVVLVVCLLPQLLRMYVTKSARDLSYAFLGLYVVGLTLTALYLIFIGDAIVGWVAVICEVGVCWQQPFKLSNCRTIFCSNDVVYRWPLTLPAQI